MRRLAAALVAAALYPAAADAALITISVNPTTTLRAAIARSNADLLNSYDLRLAPGVYLNDFAPTITRPLTITGIYGATYTTLRATVAIPNSKAMLLTTSSLFVRGLTISGAFISNALGGNGAGIRSQSTTASTLRLDGVQIAGNQEGVLTGGSRGQENVVVVNSAFRNNGNASVNNGQEHALYVTDAASLVVGNSVFCGTVGQGHNIKSRAAATTISGVRSYEGVAGGSCAATGNASRGIDVPNGGVLSMSNVDLFQGPATGNSGMMEFGAEGLKFSVNRASLTNVDFVNTRSSGIGIQWFGGTNQCTLTNVTFSGVTPQSPTGCTGTAPLLAATLAAEAAPVAVPEPGSLALLIGALAGFGIFRRRRNRDNLAYAE